MPFAQWFQSTHSLHIAFMSIIYKTTAFIFRRQRSICASVSVYGRSNNDPVFFFFSSIQSLCQRAHSNSSVTEEERKREREKKYVQTQTEIILNSLHIGLCFRLKMLHFTYTSSTAVYTIKTCPLCSGFFFSSSFNYVFGRWVSYISLLFNWVGYVSLLIKCCAIAILVLEHQARPQYLALTLELHKKHEAMMIWRKIQRKYFS